jgi:hypothetical protein
MSSLINETSGSTSPRPRASYAARTESVDMRRILRLSCSAADELHPLLDVMLALLSG